MLGLKDERVCSISTPPAPPHTENGIALLSQSHVRFLIYVSLSILGGSGMKELKGVFEF